MKIIIVLVVWKEITYYLLQLFEQGDPLPLHYPLLDLEYNINIIKQKGILEFLGTCRSRMLKVLSWSPPYLLYFLMILPVE